MNVLRRASPRKILGRVLGSPLTRIIVVVTLLGVLVTFSQSRFFDITNFTCKSQYGPCTAEEISSLEKFKGGNMVMFNTKPVVDKLKHDFMNRKVVVQKVFPNTIIVTLEKRKAVVAFATLSGDGYFLLDRDGVVVEFVKTTNLPYISAPELPGLVVGHEAEDKFRRAASITYLVFRSQGVKQVKLENSTIVAQLQSGLRVIFPLEGDPQVLMGALQLILARSRMMDKLPKEIDLRYSKPVLRY